jgi:CheY-like chemotaxis protein
MAERPRILVLGDGDSAAAERLRRCAADGELVRAESWAAGLDLLRREPFDAVLANPADVNLMRAVRGSVQSERILDTLTEGVALVDFDLRVRWANPAFDAWCGGPAVGRGFYEALGAPRADEGEYCPFHSALARQAETAPDTGSPGAVTCRLHCKGERTIDLRIVPVYEPGGRLPLLVAVGRDVSSEVRQQQRLDTLHRAGLELSTLSSDQLAEMSVAERVEHLKLNIRHFTRDLLHYETIEIRVLDRQTGHLEPLLQEGMTPEAAGRVLLAHTEDHGVTGYVAATGKSYLCRDTSLDPLYILGAAGARSSLTVPLMYRDQVIGTFNVEAQEPNAFAESDLQYAELFCRDIAEALHTLELLSAEKSSSATQSLEAVSREVALPVDDILAASTSLLDRYVGHDADMANKLRKIIASARTVKQSIQKVGEDVGLEVSRNVSAGRQPPPTPLKGVRVLVADSDDRTRRSAHSLLGRWGCVVETARDGREALIMARLSTYDAVLADIRLPDMTGFEFFCQVRQAQPQARVILMTAFGYDAAHCIVNARRDGLQHVLYKPFRVEQLLDALRGLSAAPVARSVAAEPA